MIADTSAVVSFEFFIPQGIDSGEYIGQIFIDDDNIESIPIDVIIKVSNPPEKPNRPSGNVPVFTSAQWARIPEIWLDTQALTLGQATRHEVNVIRAQP